MHPDPDTPLDEPLTEPPGEEGDNTQAAGGRPAYPVDEEDLEDADQLEEDEEDGDGADS